MKGWALITGAGRRIGHAIALELAATGFDIVVHYNRSRNEAEQLAHDIEKLGRRAALAEFDLTKTQPVQKLIPHLSAELGPLAALINNASLFEPDRMDPDDTRHNAINATAPRILSESFYTSHSPNSSSATPVIINMLDADLSVPGFNAYTRSKQTLAALTMDMAKRFAPNVRVNGIALGPVLPSACQSAEHFGKLVQSTPLQTRILPEAVAATVCFLIENPVITGEIIYVDGGMHLNR
jgi:NAD(P)-dependent dehydrogenase (short-subunit alcohol dehydrogenase family)